MKKINSKRILEVRPTLEQFKEIFAELKIICSVLEEIPYYTENIFGNEINTPHEFYQKVKKHKENLSCYIKTMESLKCSKCGSKDFHIGFDPAYKPSEVAVCEFCNTSNPIPKDKPTNEERWTEKDFGLPNIEKPKDSKMEKILSQIDMKPKDSEIKRKVWKEDITGGRNEKPKDSKEEEDLLTIGKGSFEEVRYNSQMTILNKEIELLNQQRNLDESSIVAKNNEIKMLRVRLAKKEEY